MEKYRFVPTFKLYLQRTNFLAYYSTDEYIFDNFFFLLKLKKILIVLKVAEILRFFIYKSRLNINEHKFYPIRMKNFFKLK